jgi:hypothetical protein
VLIAELGHGGGAHRAGRRARAQPRARRRSRRRRQRRSGEALRRLGAEAPAAASRTARARPRWWDASRGWPNSSATEERANEAGAGQQRGCREAPRRLGACGCVTHGEGSATAVGRVARLAELERNRGARQRGWRRATARLWRGAQALRRSGVWACITHGEGIVLIAELGHGGRTRRAGRRARAQPRSAPTRPAPATARSGEAPRRSGACGGTGSPLGQGCGRRAVLRRSPVLLTRPLVAGFGRAGGSHCGWLPLSRAAKRIPRAGRPSLELDPRRGPGRAG